MRYLPLTLCPGLMNCGKFYALSGLLLLLLFAPANIFAAEEFAFDMEEFTKKPLKTGGYIEGTWQHMDINQGSAFSLLNLSGHDLSTMDRFSVRLQLDGKYDQGISSFNWLLNADAGHDDLGWNDTTDIYEAYASVKPTSYFTGSIGKKSSRWGKGYAWNPVGFINRVKDPNDPEEALEGYITLEADLVKSYTGSLRTTALTAVLLPVRDNVNDDFGEINHLNFAARLYFLFLDTDIDLIVYTGQSRSNRYGLDFSGNIAPNFEIHGEWAYIPDNKKVTLNENDSILIRDISAFSFLLGLRYLADNNLTSIIEYYHNDAGYSADEMDLFYQLFENNTVNNAKNSTLSLLDRAENLSRKGYGRAQPGRDYLYARFSLKEPFDILYLTPALTTIINLDDQSYSIMSEIIYTGFTNWQLRLRYASLNGSNSSEYGEKAYSSKLELRLRYFF